MDQLLDKYGESHQNATNKFIHWICVPSIVFSLFGLLYAIPFPFAEKTWYLNWGAIVALIASLYYFRLSFVMAISMLTFMTLVMLGNSLIYEAVGRSNGMLALVCFGIFFVAWVGQFIGHKIEGAKPSFIEDVQYLMVGPAWLLHFVFKKLGVKY